MSIEHSPAREGRFGRLLTRDEVCRLLGRSAASLYRDIAAGLIPPPIKIGHSSRWTESEIDEVIKRGLKQRDGEA